MGGAGPARGRPDRGDEAVTLYREPADRHPVFRPDFADSSVAYGIRLTELGDFDAALSADREAVSVYSGVLVLDPERYREAMERAVHDLAVALKDPGRSEQEIEDELGRLLPDPNRQPRTARQSRSRIGVRHHCAADVHAV